VFALNALVGALDRPGGLLQAAAPGASHRDADAADALADMAAHPTMSDIVVLRDASALRTLDATGDVGAALDRCKLVVSVSPYLDEAAAVADLLLPAHTALESWHGVVPPSPDGAEQFACAKPAARARLDTRDLITILHTTAEHLHGDTAALCPHASGEGAIGAELARRWNLRRGGTYANAFETNWMLQLERGGWWVPAAPSLPSFVASILDAGGWVDPYFSPGEMTAAITARGGLTFQPAAAPPPPALPTSSVLPASIGGEDAERPAGEREWPLRLVPFTPPEVNLAGGPNQPVLFELLGQPDGAPWCVWAELNPETARGLGVANGAKIRVASPSGAIDVTAMVVERTPPEIVAVAFVPFLRTGGRWAKLMSADVRHLLDRAGRGGVRVRVTPA
jgi:anaerobic selenocysteine-containing dehydrogenase